MYAPDGLFWLNLYVPVNVPLYTPLSHLKSNDLGSPPRRFWKNVCVWFPSEIDQ